MPFSIGTFRALLASKPAVASSSTPTVVSVSTATNSLTGGALTINAPTGITAGNLLVGISSSGTETWTPPSGWSLYGTVAASGDDPQLSVFTKTATGSEPSSYTFTGNNQASDAINFGILNISGANTSSPINGLFSKRTTTAAVTIGTSGTSIPTVLGCLPVAINAIGQLNLSNSGPPTGLTSGWTGQFLAVDEDTSSYGNTGDNNGYAAVYVATGPITTSTTASVTAGWTWAGAYDEFTGTSLMIFVA